MEFEKNPVAEIEELLDELDDLVDTASSLPLSKKKLINEDEIVKIIGEIRNNLPAEFAQAKQIVKDARDIKMLAGRERDEIIAKAESDAQALVEKEEIVKRAKALANDIVTKAQNESKEITRATAAYLDRLLAQTDDAVCQSLNDLRKAKSMLKIEGENAPVQPVSFDDWDADVDIDE